MPRHDRAYGRWHQNGRKKGSAAARNRVRRLGSYGKKNRRGGNVNDVLKRNP